MILKIYTVKDLQVQAFLPPFYARTDGEAGRSFIQAISTGGLKQNPTDYELHHIGTFNDESSELQWHGAKYLTNGHEALKIYNKMLEETRPRTFHDNLNRQAQTDIED